MNKTLYICILATFLYNNYLPYFIKSLKHFYLPNFSIKVIIISDKKQYDEYLYYPIGHFPYPFNTYLKSFIIQNALEYYNCSEDDYIMYVDADTIIRKLDNYIFIEELLSQNKLWFTISPWSNFQYTYENDILKKNYPEVYIQNIQKQEFIQSSFWMGNIKLYNNFCKLCFSIELEFTKDWKNKRIPPMQDQSIITKIIHNNKDIYKVDYFIFNYYKNITLDDIHNYYNNTITCNNTFNINQYPYIFLIQKFNQDIKKSLRYSIKIN